MTERIRILYIVGPTASGKSAVSLEVAAALGGAIISADSMQVYRGMDIGTAKPTTLERERIPHYLIDIKQPDEPFSVADFQRLAREAIDAARARGLLPMVVGGTGLYLKSLLDDYQFGQVSADLAERDRLRAIAGREGSDRLHAMLSEVDPEASRRIHPNDVRRLVRALEYHRLTDTPLSANRSVGERRGRGDGTVIFGLTMERTELHRRIERRVALMMDNGLMEEVKRLVDDGFGERAVAMQAVGYKELLGVIRGQWDVDEALRLIIRNTKRLAKRQYTWFRRDERVRWLDVSSGGHLRAISGICDFVRAGAVDFCREHSQGGKEKRGSGENEA